MSALPRRAATAVAALVAIAVVAHAFAAYLTPDHLIDWLTLGGLCT